MALIDFDPPIPASLPAPWTLAATQNMRSAKMGDEVTVVLLEEVAPQTFEERLIDVVALAKREARAPYATQCATLAAVPLEVIDAGLMSLHVQLIQRMRTPPPVPVETDEPWMDQLKRDRQGRPYEEMGNVDLVLTHAEPWHDALWYDTMCGKAMLGDQPITDYTGFAMEIGRLVDMPVRNAKLHEKVIRSRCMAQPRDRLQEYLASLQGAWDGTDRLTTWLQKYAGVENTDAMQYISWMFPVSMVARGLDPGCDMRYAVIFEGEEEIGKGQILRTLGGEFYKEITEITGKEARMALRGVWLGELSELHALSRAELAHIKAFISAVADPYVPKYENDGVVQARRCVLAGTTNEDVYLKTGGNTRFFPVKCHGVIDYEGLEEMRDQLFAEALTQYAKHIKTWWKIPSDAKEQLIQLRKDKQEPNVYDNRVRTYLDGKAKVTLEEVLVEGLKIDAPEKWKDRALQMQVSLAVKNVGWESARTGDERYWVGPHHKKHSRYTPPPPSGATPKASVCPEAPNGRHDPWVKGGVLTCFHCDAMLF